MIERYGVSVYDLNDLPEPIQKSEYIWTCNIRTRDRQLLSTILSKISLAKIDAMSQKKMR
jgi:hypothetical protein